MKHEITARRLALAMERKDMIARELADMTGIHKSSISQYVNGSHIPSNVSAGKIAKVLGVNPVWLMGYDVPMFVGQKHPGEMGREAEKESLRIQEASALMCKLTEENQKRAIGYLEKLLAIQEDEMELNN